MRRRDRSTRLTPLAWALSFALLAAAQAMPAAQASGLDDLRKALAGLRGTAPIKVTL